MLNFFDDNLSPLKFFFLLIIGGVIDYLGFLSYHHIFHFKEVWAHTYSTGGQILDIILWPVAVVVIIIAVIISIKIVRAALIYSNIFVNNSPQIIKHEIEIIQRIWNNRGFGKYSLFGGISFYLKLRLRVLAYFFAFLGLGIITWYFVFQQHTYEKTYWKINFYYKEPLPTFIFKPNKPYTIKSDADFYGIIINGKRYVTGKNTSWREDEPNKIALSLPNHWNTIFQDTTRIEFMFYSGPINETFSQTLEVWEGKSDGNYISPKQFSYENKIMNKDSNNKNKIKKNKK